jgi:two-component system nitrate/nitrite response regulator NarL
VLTLLAEGASSEDIAAKLSVSPNTVRTHVQSILTKLQVHSRLEAATFAVRYGIVKVTRSTG